MKLAIQAGVFAFCAASAILAQEVSGTISGTVLDPSGASIAKANVTLTNTDRNQVIRTVVTGVDGAYSFPVLPVGTYALKVEAAGFVTQQRHDIHLNANDKLTINISLAIGNMTEQVNVTEAADVVNLGDAAQQNTISGTQIRELPMPTRNYEQLVMLAPGVSGSQTDELYIGVSLPSGLAAAIPYSVNGMRNSSNNWTIDGADNVDRGGNLTLLNYPSVDALSEFKVLRSVYTADTGRAGGAQVNVVTKSGGHDFHGDVYEFFRNDKLAANNTLNNMNGIRRPPLRWNDFGYTFGGPIFIPHHYNVDRNKTFFFWSQEFRRVITYTTFTSIVPTAAEKQGNFAAPVCVAYTGSTCNQTASQITNINPVAAAYLKDIFSGIGNGAAGTNSLVTPLNSVFNATQEMIRIDHSFNEKFSIWGRFLNDSIPTVEPGGLFTGEPIANLATTHTNSPGRTAVGHALWTIRPTLLNEIGYNFSYGAINSTPVGLMARANSPDINVNLPFASTLGVLPALSFSGAGTSILGFGPYNEYNRNHNFFDNLSWVHGRHSFKFGVTGYRYEKTENAAGNNYGTFTFSTTPRPTGTSTFEQAWANFLLGNVGTFTQASQDITPDLTAWQWEAYVQDDFKVNSRLTLYAGVRWSYFGQPVDQNNMLDNFDPYLYNRGNAPQVDPATGNLVSGTGTQLNGIIVGDRNSPYGKRIANNNWKDFAPRLGIAWDPVGDGLTSVRAGYGIYYDSPLFGGYEQNIFANPPFVQSISISNSTLSNPTAGTQNVSLSPLSLHGSQLPNLTPYSQQWSMDIQRQLPKDFILDVGYVGTKGTHLLGIIDLNEAPPGLALAAGLHSGPGTVFTSADDPRINAVRPYLGYNAINTIEPWFNSNYHSLQVAVDKHFGQAGQFGLSYTWSHNMTDNWSDRSNAPQNSYNFHEGEYGPAMLDRRQVLTINYVYTLPFARKSHGAVGAIAHGWEVSGITSFMTGLPTTASATGVDPAGLGFLGASAAGPRPDMTCDPNSNAPHTYTQWFNTSCFPNVPDGAVRPGDEGRGVIRMPGSQIWDVSLYKTFPLSERFRLQLRGESFNTFNHPNPSGFASLLNTSTLFGRIGSFREARVVQVAGKLYF